MLHYTKIQYTEPKSNANNTSEHLKTLPTILATNLLALPTSHSEVVYPDNQKKKQAGQPTRNHNFHLLTSPTNPAIRRCRLLFFAKMAPPKRVTTYACSLSRGQRIFGYSNFPPPPTVRFPKKDPFLSMYCISPLSCPSIYLLTALLFFCCSGNL